MKVQIPADKEVGDTYKFKYTDGGIVFACRDDNDDDDDDDNDDDDDDDNDDDSSW